MWYSFSASTEASVPAVLSLFYIYNVGTVTVADLGERTLFPMKHPLTLESLLSKYTLDSHIIQEIIQERIECEDRAIVALMFNFDKILRFVNHIELDPAEKCDVETARQVSTGAAMTKALEFWSRINPSFATFENLLLYLVHHGEGKIAMAVCKYLFERAKEVC